MVLFLLWFYMSVTNIQEELLVNGVIFLYCNVSYHHDLNFRNRIVDCLLMSERRNQSHLIFLVF